MTTKDEMFEQAENYRQAWRVLLDAYRQIPYVPPDDPQKKSKLRSILTVADAMAYCTKRRTEILSLIRIRFE